jgi:hypothetical protein
MGLKAIQSAQQLVRLKRAGAGAAELQEHATSVDFGGVKIHGAARVALGAAAAVALPALLPATLLPHGQRMMSSLTPGTSPGPVTNDIAWAHESGNSGWGAATVMGCNLIPNPAIKAACMAFVGRGGSGGSGNSGSLVPQQCPTGYQQTATGCQQTGISRFLPGDIGAPDMVWSTVMGRYGAGYIPMEVQRVHRACPAGSKLGKDGLCYDRISRTNRMHNPGARPLFTGGDMNTLRRARMIQKRGRKAMSKVLPSTTKRCATTKGRKK